MNYIKCLDQVKITFIVIDINYRRNNSDNALWDKLTKKCKKNIYRPILVPYIAILGFVSKGTHFFQNFINLRFSRPRDL